MRMKLLKVVVVLLLSGSGDARPQKTDESLQRQPTKANAEGWRSSGVQNVREDSRYRWNSGGSRLPYVHYHDTVSPFVDRSDEVSVDEPKGSRSNDPWNSPKAAKDSRDPFRNEIPRNTNGFVNGATGNATKESIRDSRPRASTIPNERAIKSDNLTGSKSTFHRPIEIPLSTSTVLASSSNGNHGGSSSRKLEQKSSTNYTRVPLSNTRISYFGEPTNKIDSTSPMIFSSNSSDARDKIRRRTGEIILNNSRSVVPSFGQHSRTKFSDRKRFTSTLDGNSVKVEATARFDHVAAIRRITGMLIRERSPAEAKNDVDDDKRTIVSTEIASVPSNRRSNSKHPNRTKLRRPQYAQSSKNGQSKVDFVEISANKNHSFAQYSHLKNWPNGAIQDVDDLHHYDKYTSLEDDAKIEQTIEKPVSSNDSTFVHRVPVSSPTLQEIVHWMKVPAFMANGSQIVESDQDDRPIGVAFDPIYPNLEPNRPSRPGEPPTFRPDFVYPLHTRPSYATEKVPNWLENVLPNNKTVYNPQTHVSQNTVVHLINTNLRKPNRTTVITKVPGGSNRPTVSGSPGSYSSSFPSVASSGSSSYPPSWFLSQLSSSPSATTKPGPNVHIGFTSYEEVNDKVTDQQAPQAPMVTYDQRCPTILINSYTRINNTIQSKEGCTDLNIIINSHVFNTNVYKSTPSPQHDQTNPEDYQTHGEVDKYGSGVQENVGPNYQSVPIYQSSSGSPQWPQNDYNNPPRDPQNDPPQQGEVSNVEVIQDTQISISSSGALNDEPPSDSLDPSLPIESQVAEEDESGVPGDSPGSSAVTASETGQTSDNGANSLTRPAASSAGSNPGSSNGSPPSSLLATGSPLASSSASSSDDDDDDDDDYDMSPSGIMESIASVFTYFTVANPLHYGLFSLAAAPFTALAAGILGIVTFLYPWLFPSSFGFARASNGVVDGFWPNLEEVVRQSMYRYEGLNEWKSKRKKRKR